MQKIGLFGGTFNPVHLGHLSIACEVRERLSLDSVIFIPTGTPPHKVKTDLIAPEHRLRMVELAIAPYGFFTASSIETERKGLSYSIDTVTALKKEMGEETEFYFIIGIDAFVEINTWKNADELLTMCNFVVIPRPGHRFADLKNVHIPLIKKLPADELGKIDSGETSSLSFPLSGNYYLLLEKITLCDISSTELRKLIRDGQEVKNLLPDSVMSYIMRQRLYLIDKKENITKR